MDVLVDRVSHPMAKAGGLSVLNQIMRRALTNVCEEVRLWGKTGWFFCVRARVHSFARRS